MQTITVALIGNPNTGKTTLFNALSGLNHRVGNFPGVTVEMKKGTAHHPDATLELLDLPGTYSLAARSPDEMVSVDLLLGLQVGEKRPDVIVNVVDASNLERHLYLTTQLLELGVPVVVALNMVDVAEAQRLKIDAPRLAEQLGVPVVAIRANKSAGLNELKSAMIVASRSTTALVGATFPDAFEAEVGTLAASATGNGPLPAFLARRMLIDVGGYAEQRASERYGPTFSGRLTEARARLQAAGCSVPMVEARTRFGWLRQRLVGVVEHPPERVVTWTDRIDAVLTHRIWGTLIFLAVMFLVFQAIFTAAAPLMDLVDQGFSALKNGGSRLFALVGMPTGPLPSLVCDGIIGGVGSVLIFLPQILILFGFIAILEDCGYMARAAFLMDRLMSRCGLSGKSFIPLLSSMACAVPGIMGARVIENRRDRLATILVAPLMTCSARLPLYVLLTSIFFSDPWWLPGLMLFGLYAVGLVTAPLVALLLKRTLLRGETPLFVLEMPVYQWPSVFGVLRRMWDAGRAFLVRAGTIILATMILVWALLYFPGVDDEGRSYEARIAEKLDEVKDQRDELEKLDEQTEDARKQIARLKKAGHAADSAEIQEILANDDTGDKLARIDELKKVVDPVEAQANELTAEHKGRSILGRTGQFLEPAFRPLGWDWKIGVAALASFPAREVIVSTLSLVYGKGEADAGEVAFNDDPAGTDLGQSISSEWSADTMPGGPAARIPRALSLLVFFALCSQCASTLAVIRRETGSWGWAVFTFVYMTVLAYVAALVVFQIGAWFVSGG